MKKTIFLSFATIAVLNFSSCKKMDVETNDVTATEETVNATVNSNESYQFTLPSQVSTDQVSISSPAAKSAVAIVNNSGTTSNFVYTPDPNFSGTDVVVVTQNTSTNSQGGCGHHDKKKNRERKECGTPNQGCTANLNNNNGHQCNGHHKDGSKSAHGSQHKITFNITVKQIIN